MTHSAGTLSVYAFIMFLTGIGIPVMAALNGGLGQRIGSAPAAAAVLFALALVIAVGATTLTGWPSRGDWSLAPAHYFAGGLFVAFYVLCITWIAPRFGVANAVFFVLLGQIVAAAVIDHFGLLGAPLAPINMRRIVGIVLMAAGIYLARRQ